MAKWVGENPKQDKTNDARQTLAEFYLKLYKQEKWDQPATPTSPDWWRTRAALSRLVAFELIQPDNPSWSKLLRHHAKLLSAYAKYQFDRNLTFGLAADNDKISDIQKDFMETLHKFVAFDATNAPAASSLLQQHLAPWMEHHEWAVVDRMYEELAGFSPPDERRRTETALAKIWRRGRSTSTIAC